jgi:hypothetical protein
MFQTTREIDLLDRGLDKRRALIEPLENLHTGSKRGNPTSSPMIFFLAAAIALW